MLSGTVTTGAFVGDSVGIGLGHVDGTKLGALDGNSVGF